MFGLKYGIRNGKNSDPGWKKFVSESGINNSDPQHWFQPESYIRELNNHFLVKILKFFDADPDPQH
jgi:hypothetical protein